MTLLYSTDPGEAAHWQTKGLVREWMEENDKGGGGDFGVSDRSNALYYWKKAIQWGDDKAEKHWEAEYRKMGGTDQNMAQSLTRSAPLGGVAQRDRETFLRSLDEQERDVVALAEKWWRSVYSVGGSGPRRPTRPARPTRPTPQRPTRPGGT